MGQVWPTGTICLVCLVHFREIESTGKIVDIIYIDLDNHFLLETEGSINTGLTVHQSYIILTLRHRWEMNGKFRVESLRTVCGWVGSV